MVTLFWLWLGALPFAALLAWSLCRIAKDADQCLGIDPERDAS